MNEITEAMVEAAASAFFAVTADQIGKAGSSYSALPEASKDKVRICARAALEAALSANTVVPDDADYCGIVVMDDDAEGAPSGHPEDL